MHLHPSLSCCSANHIDGNINEVPAAARTDANTTKGHSNTPHRESMKASHTFDTITLLDRAQHLELLQHIDSVVQHIEDKWNEDGKADSPSGPS